MIKKIRPRYYCEYCNKASGSAAAMKRHEKGCTANPGRECGICRETGLEQQSMLTLLEQIVDDGELSLKNLRDVTDGCPACIFAAIRISEVNICDDPLHRIFPDWMHWGDRMKMNDKSHIDFNVREEIDEYWREHNERDDVGSLSL